MENTFGFEKKEFSDIEKIADITPPKLNDKLEETKIKKTTRIMTGIPGLDNLLNGGFIPNSVVLIAGEAGSGKTILCTQFIWNALCMGENGVYVTLQQEPNDIKNDVILFGKDFYAAEVRDQVRVIYTEPDNLDKIIKTILKNVKEINAKRLVIDSITLLGEQSKDVRRNLNYLVRELKRMGVTTLITAEIPEGSDKISKFGIEEFIVDGVIVLRCGADVAGNLPRSLEIKKMRRTKHDLNYHPFEIADNGIRIIR